MTAVNIKLYKLLIKLGATEQEAEEVTSELLDTKTAVLTHKNQVDKELATFDNNFDKLEAQITTAKTALETRIDKMESTIKIFLGFNIAVLAAFFATLLTIVFTTVFK